MDYPSSKQYLTYKESGMEHKCIQVGQTLLATVYQKKELYIVNACTTCVLFFVLLFRSVKSVTIISISTHNPIH